MAVVRTRVFRRFMSISVCERRLVSHLADETSGFASPPRDGFAFDVLWLPRVSARSRHEASALQRDWTDDLALVPAVAERAAVALGAAHGRRHLHALGQVRARRGERGHLL